MDLDKIFKLLENDSGKKIVLKEVDSDLIREKLISLNESLLILHNDVDILISNLKKNRLKLELTEFLVEITKIQNLINEKISL